MKHPAAPPADADLGLLRRAVAWANSQREDYWFPDGQPMPWATVLGVYCAVVRHLGSELEEVIADNLPFPFSSYSKEDQAAINYVRTAVGLPRKRA